MNCVEFNVYGEPMAKQRPKISMNNGYARAYTPKNTILYENKVAQSYKEVANDYMFERNDLLEITIIANFSLVSGDYGKKGLNKNGRDKLSQIYCPKHKDLDNIIKVVLDGLNGIAYLDDKQIVKINAVKKWVENNPKVQVILQKI